MALVDLVPLLAALLLVIVCYALLVGYKFTLGALLGLLARILNVRIPVVGAHPFAFIAAGINAFDSFLRAQLASGIQAGEWAWAKVLHAHAVLWHDLTGAVADLAEATERALGHVPRTIIQTIIPAWVYPLRKTVGYLSRQVAHLLAASAKVVHTITHMITHETTKVITQVERITVVKVKTEAAALPRKVVATIPGLGTIDRHLHGIDETLKDALRKLTRPAIAASVAVAIAGLGLSWARCSRVRKTGKVVCGMDDGLLESLLTDAVILASTISVVEFAHSCQAFTSEATGALDLFVRELRDLAPVAGVAGGAALSRYIAGDY